MKLDQIYSGGGNSLKAADLKGKDVTLTIAGYTVQEFDETGQHGPYKAKKIVLTFDGTDKTFVVNKINGYTIAEQMGIDDPDYWAGGKVTLFQTKTTFGSEMVDCIRVKDASAPVTTAGPKTGEVDSGIPF